MAPSEKNKGKGESGADCAPFEALGSRFADLTKVGSGSYGVVCSAVDSRTLSKVAIKRVSPWADDEWDARHTLRELRLMRLLRSHPNIITLRDAILEPSVTNELFLVMELMDSDLHRVISSKQSLTPQHVSCLMAQLLLGAQAMHSIGVLHRDLKPGNILVSRACELRITDFGLSRHVGVGVLGEGGCAEDDGSLEPHPGGSAKKNPLTEYVVTRWYRCPEVLLAPHLPYTAAVDCWSIGCIFGELIARRPLFQGKNFVHQVQVILQKLGSPAAGALGFEPRDDAARFLAKQPQQVSPGFEALLPAGTDPQRALCERLLRFDPRSRYAVAEALCSDFFDDPPELPPAVRPYFDEQRAAGAAAGHQQHQHQHQQRVPSAASSSSSSTVDAARGREGRGSLDGFREAAVADASFDFSFERADTSLAVLRAAIAGDVAVLNGEISEEEAIVKSPRRQPRHDHDHNQQQQQQQQHQSPPQKHQQQSATSTAPAPEKPHHHHHHQADHPHKKASSSTHHRRASSTSAANKAGPATSKHHRRASLSTSSANKGGPATGSSTSSTASSKPPPPSQQHHHHHHRHHHHHDNNVDDQTSSSSSSSSVNHPHPPTQRHTRAPAAPATASSGAAALSHSHHPTMGDEARSPSTTQAKQVRSSRATEDPDRTHAVARRPSLDQSNPPSSSESATRRRSPVDEKDIRGPDLHGQRDLLADALLRTSASSRQIAHPPPRRWSNSTNNFHGHALVTKKEPTATASSSRSSSRSSSTSTTMSFALPSLRPNNNNSQIGRLLPTVGARANTKLALGNVPADSTTKNPPGFLSKLRSISAR